jgi:DNA repair protein RadC
MAISDWPAQERPREKLLQKGADALSDAELLAIFLRTGVQGYSAVDLARLLLDDFGGLRPLLQAGESEFCQRHGLGPAKFVQLQAVLEMARRHLFLDNRNRIISFDKMFYGTIDGASVYPREVVKLALKKNAAAVIFAHNHPSGVAEPSRSDEQITQRLKQALEVVDIRVLDHMVIGDEVVSFAERGLL